MKYISVLITVLVLGIFGIAFYSLIFHDQAQSLYCKKRIGLKLYSFRQAVKTNGADQNLEENEDVKKFLSEMYDECL